MRYNKGRSGAEMRRIQEGKMPAQYTHQIYAETLLSLLPEEERARISDLPAYYLGAQGGDVFYFLRLVTPGGGNLGKYLHNTDVYGFFSEMLASLRRGGGAAALSYAAGYVTHYALDTVFHPFVYGTTEKLIAAHPKSRIRWHAYIESDIDSHFIRKLRGISVTDYVSPLRISELDVPALYAFLSGVFDARGRRHFSLFLFRRALRRYFLFERAFTDRTLRRRRMLHAAESALHCQRAFSSLCRRTGIDENCLNTEREEWRNPSDPSFVSHESADDLFSRALAEGERLTGLFFAALGGAPLPEADFSKGFLSGIDCSLPHVRPGKK